MRLVHVQKHRDSVINCCLMFFMAAAVLQTALGQDTLTTTVSPLKIETPQNDLIEIADEPRMIDPATLVLPALGRKVSVRFDGEPLKKVLNWLQEEQSINVVVDYRALESVKLLETEPVFEELKDAPIYFLLSRLQHLGLAWYESEDTMQMTSQFEYLKHDRTVSYNLSDLIDEGFLPQNLLTTIHRVTDLRKESTAETNPSVLLGDVVFIRQVDSAHREIAGLLKALQKPARRTFTLDAPQNDELRSALQQKFSVDFQQTPLFAAVNELSRLTGIQIRLERHGINKANVRERTPVTLKANDQKLADLLRGMLSNLGLHWYLQDGALWITTIELADEAQKTAVFDVRDLCADKAEALALKTAIATQTRAKWRTDTGSGYVLETPKPGVLVARNSEAALDEVSKLLEDYRNALKVSKPRASPKLNPDEVTAGYYRMPEPMADSLTRLLPTLIEPETWKSPARPDQPGTIVAVTSETNLTDTKGNPVPQVVLVIHQSRAVHQTIGKFIQTLLQSKSIDTDAGLGTRQSEKESGTFGRNLIPGGAK